MARKTKQVPNQIGKVTSLTDEPLVEDEEPIEEYKEYNMWITVNNHSTGVINMEIRQYGKPKDPVHPN